MTFLKHLTLPQLEQLLKEKKTEKQSFTDSINAGKKNPILFSSGALRSFRINRIRLNADIKEIQKKIDFHKEA